MRHTRNIRNPWGFLIRACLSSAQFTRRKTALRSCFASSAVTTLLRCPGIQYGDNEKYCLTTEKEHPSHRNVDRAAIAQCIADMIADEALEANESLGITN